MYGSLLALIFFLPASYAMISILQGIIVALWLFKRVMLWKLSPKASLSCFDIISNKMSLPVAAIGVLIALTIPFSQYPYVSFKKLFTRFLFQALLMFFIPEVINSRKRLRGVMTILLSVIFFVAVDCLFQYFCGYDFIHHSVINLGRVNGPMNQANDLGTLLVTVLPVVFVSILIARQRAPMAFLFLILIGVLGLTDSRGAWFAFGLSMVALGLSLRHRKSVIFIILLLGMMVWLFGMYCLSTRVDIYQYMTPTHGPEMKPTWTNPWGLPAQYNAWQLLTAPSGRSGYWDTAMEVIKRYPWFGCGFNAYMKTVTDMNSSYMAYPHNSLLHITAELGLVGLVLYLWLFVALCWQIKNILTVVSRQRDLLLLGIGLSCGILAWLLHSLLDTPWSSLSLGLLLWIIIGILMSLAPLAKLKGETT
jgi:O-antigen ligase